MTGLNKRIENLKFIALTVGASIIIPLLLAFTLYLIL